jgi:hypothetical protein
MTMPMVRLGQGGYSDYVIIDLRNGVIVVCLIAGRLGRMNDDVARKVPHVMLLVA